MALLARFSVSCLALGALLAVSGCSDLVARNTYHDPADTGTSDQDWPGENNWPGDDTEPDDDPWPDDTGWTGDEDPPWTDEDTDWTGDEETGTDDGGGNGDAGTDEPACDDENDTVLYLSPDDSNSMSSPVQAREAVLSQWHSLSAVPIRAWEFFNYYSFDYPAAAPGNVAIDTQMYRDPEFPEGEYLLQIGVSSQALTHAQRAPMSITFVLDTSGSMTGEPLQLLKETCKAIAASLKNDDVVSMVTWDTENAVILAGHGVEGPNDEALLDAIDGIAPGGGTDLHGGLVAGYELASQAYAPGRINRIVLVSDGGANVGVTDAELIASYAGGQNQDGIYMVGVGVGSSSTYHDDLMDAVTDAGKGASVYIPDMEGAWTVFNQDFVNTMAVAARDVRVRLDMPPGFALVTFSGEEHSPDPEEVEPQHLAPNDAMVFHQRIATCAPELVDEQSSITVTASYKDVTTFEQREVTQTRTIGELLEADQAMLRKGAAILAYTEALEAKKQGMADEAAIVDAALVALTGAETALPGDSDLEEIREVLEALD